MSTNEKGEELCPVCNEIKSWAWCSHYFHERTQPAAETPSLTPETDAKAFKVEHRDMNSFYETEQVYASDCRTIELARNSALSDLAEALKQTMMDTECIERIRTVAMRLEVERDEAKTKTKETAKDFETAFRLVRQENDDLRQRLEIAERERDEARRKATALNGCRNQMANAFNANDAEAFWAADSRANGLVEEWVPELAMAIAQRDQLRTDLATITADRDAARAEAVRLQADAVVMREVARKAHAYFDSVPLEWASPETLSSAGEISKQAESVGLMPRPGAPLLSALEALAVALKEVVKLTTGYSYGGGMYACNTAATALDLARPFRAAPEAAPSEGGRA